MNLQFFGYLFVFLFSFNVFSGESAHFEGEPCDGLWFNDAMADYCQGLGYESRVHNAGTRYAYYSFEEVSRWLEPELEEDYDMVLLVNSAEGRTSSGAFIPNQHMLALAKPKGQKRMFLRDGSGIITGLAPGVKQVSSIVGSSVIKSVANTGKGHGKVISWNGLEAIPVSTGATWHLPSFSGIFQVNWGRSVSNLATGWGAPMSNQFYFGYFYHSSKSSSAWTNGNRERVSYAAVHGTPKKNWHLLGKSRASHGCTRVHPAIMEGLRGYANKLPMKSVIELDWDYPWPVQDQQTPMANRKPVLIMVFNEYEGMSL